MTELFRQLLAKRKLGKDFLHPRYEDLFDPLKLRGVKTAVARIEQARAEKEQIVIYGDYDADGVTASIVVHDALCEFGCVEPKIVLPDRFRDGYGMNLPAVDKIESMGTHLVVTVDCGSGSEETIAALRKKGIETIVTDHHEIPQVPKSAVAVINPQQDRGLGAKMAGVGVAFTLARALNAHKHGGKCNGQEKWLLDLVAIGTICDSMILRDENRIMVFYGMKVLAKTRRIGLRMLAQRAGVRLDKLNAHAIGFQLGPRINASGRMKSAELALKLLMTDKRAEAFALSEELEGLNQERRKLQELAVKEVAEQYCEGDKVVVAQGKWHEGVIGIIAGRIVEQYHKPAFALTEVEKGVWKGSGRSFGDFSLADFLANCKDLLLGGGGHAMACGVSLKGSQLAKFRRRAQEYYKSLNLSEQTHFLEQKSDLRLDDLAGLTLDFYDELCGLEPFGEGNLEPVFEAELTVAGRRVLKDKHLSLRLRDEAGRELRAMEFFAPADDLAIAAGARALVQFNLTQNEWRGTRRVEGAIISLKQL